MSRFIAINFLQLFLLAEREELLMIELGKLIIIVFPCIYIRRRSFLLSKKTRFFSKIEI